MVRSWMGGLALATVLLGGSIAMADPVVQPPKPGDYTALEKLPDWTGIWQTDWSSLFASREGKPVLMPEAAKVYAQFEADKAEGKNLQTAAANCVPYGMPQIMRMPYPIEFIFSPGRVTIAIETDSQVRRIYTDGRPLPTDPDEAFNGWSVGHWEGDSLVVDTVGFNPNTSITEGVHPTEQTHMHEVMRLVEPDRLLIETTVTDPTVFKEPFVLKTSYVRKRDWQIREYVCQENNKDAADEFGRPSMSLSK